MAGHECYHCKQWIEDGDAHDCWTTTEAASHKSIMFSRKSCYFFVRPKRNFLEVCVFLGRAVKAPQVRRADRSSTSEVANMIHIRHRDEVEAPVTEWLLEAFKFCAQPVKKAKRGARKPTRKPRS